MISMDGLDGGGGVISENTTKMSASSNPSPEPRDRAAGPATADQTFQDLSITLSPGQIQHC